jgi:hypothetical protein
MIEVQSNETKDQEGNRNPHPEAGRLLQKSEESRHAVNVPPSVIVPPCIVQMTLEGASRIGFGLPTFVGKQMVDCRLSRGIGLPLGTFILLEIPAGRGYRICWTHDDPHIIDPVPPGGFAGLIEIQDRPPNDRARVSRPSSISFNASFSRLCISSNIFRAVPLFVCLHALEYTAVILLVQQ